MNRFIKSATSLKECINDSKKEVCLIGRSNVGKSTIINGLANAKIAHTSKTPGRTVTMNFYEISNQRIVDLPGYGYARIKKSQKEEISAFLTEYLNHRENLAGIFLVLDLGVITQQDMEITKLLSTLGIDYYIVFNKIDKYPKSAYPNNKHKILNALKVNEEKIILISAKNKQNLNNLMLRIIDVNS
ncbi:ribosome biogenesis GTP-binding protein YihA/YsxC [Mycoplasma sp. T363T]|uniref:ribosome biogenesis GTP-binding protein YihA/YsxC n=1 Tax=Mycoplasma bradburyae TaxID=2963128 RepID=UPI002341854E|nr:ribosome biogenesis GTP-binding protein YihA/YsxC [Mycoplasma bradburyae]MDC4163011.1 ribosome biogenesis GTP-binding protein YihA/YsxC [Mycoplasma bradburyae]